MAASRAIVRDNLEQTVQQKADLQAKVNGLEQDNYLAVSAKNGAEARYRGQVKEVDYVQAEVDNLNERIALLEAERDTLKAENGLLKADLATVNTDNAVLNAAIDGERERIEVQ